jgi:hypothetical protein
MRYCEKLDRLGGGGSGGGHMLRGKIQFHNEPGCHNDLMGNPVLIFASSLDEARRQCIEGIRAIPNSGDIDAYVANDGPCVESTNPEFDRLVGLCLGAIK